MDFRKLVEPIIKDKTINDVFQSEVSFWREKKEKCPMHLAHGVYHLISVANKMHSLSGSFNDLDPQKAFIAGLIHEPFRPLGALEAHSKYTAQQAEEILENSGIAAQFDMDRILNAIRSHHAAEEAEPVPQDTLAQALFIADKWDMRIDRVFAYIWDTNDAYEKGIGEKISMNFGSA